ncbi:MAG: hypothetical protein R3F59_00300 [Myxococcota bacterium]
MRWGLGIVGLSALGAGCVSYWDLRKGEELPYGCVGELLWYPDADGDKWGDPGTTGKPSCGPVEQENRTASNARDCDDSDGGVTGRVGAICPAQMAFLEGGTPCVEGLQVGDSEIIASCGASPQVDAETAASDCVQWSGWDTEQPADAVQPMNRGLAALETEAEYNSVTTWLAEGGEPRIVWVDLRWSGPVDGGAWTWPDGTAPTWVPACAGGETSPADFFPDLVPGLPESDATLEESVRWVRQALIFDGTAWCRGVPDAVFSEAQQRSYAGAQVLCERPRPVLSDFAVRPDGETEATTPGVGQ